jgi:hypothetical protein
MHYDVDGLPLMTRGATMNSTSVPPAIGNTLKMWSSFLQDYSLRSKRTPADDTIKGVVMHRSFAWQ